MAAYDASMVETIYSTYINVTPSPTKKDTTGEAALSVLDTTGYLELFLWPHLSSKTATKAMLMSIVALSNEKEGSNWYGVDSDKFALFVEALLTLKMENRDDFSIYEQAKIVRFLMFGIRQLENEQVAKTMLKYMSLPVWSHLSEIQRNQAFAEHPKLKRHWQNRVQKNSSSHHIEKPTDSSPKGKKRKVVASPSTIIDLEANAVPSLIEDCKTCLANTDDEAAQYYVIHSLNFWIDAMSQLPSRRFLRSVVLHRHLLLACRRSPWLRNATQRELVTKQVELLHFYVHFPIDDQTGTVNLRHRRSINATSWSVVNNVATRVIIHTITS